MGIVSTELPDLQLRREEEDRYFRNNMNTLNEMDMGGLLFLFQFLIAMMTGDTSLIDRAELSRFSEAIGLGPDGLNDTMDRIERGEISGFRGAVETIGRVDPSRIDREALSDIRVADLIHRNNGGTLLHPDLIERMESDPQIRTYVEMTFDAADRHGIDGAMLANQFWQESRYNPNAESPAGAVGIAQFMPQHRNLWGFDSESDFRDPAMAIEGGARFMAQLTEEYGDQSLALVAYNGGGDAIDYADRNVSGNGVTIDEWMGFMEQQRATLGEGRPGLWRNETYGYIGKIDSQYWSPELIARAQAANETALASIGREPASTALASAYRAEDGALRTELGLAQLGGAGMDLSGRGANNSTNRAHITAAHREAVARSPVYDEVIGEVSERLPNLAPHLRRFEVDGRLVIDSEYAARLDAFIGDVEAAGGRVESAEYNMVNVLDYRLENGGRTNGVLLNTPHLLGRAWDGGVTGLSDSQVEAIANSHGLGAVTPGAYASRGAQFTHLDISMSDRRFREAYANPMVQPGREDEVLLATLPPAEDAADEDIVATPSSGPIGTETVPTTETQNAFVAATTTETPLDVDTAQPEPLTAAFDGEGVDEVAASAAADAEASTPEADPVVLASNNTTHPGMGAGTAI